MDEKLNAIIATEGASRMGKDTLIIVDPTDIQKEYAEKMPYLARIHDGSSGKLAPGYSGCMAVACELRRRKMTPLRLWSPEAPDFVSENYQVLEVMRLPRGSGALDNPKIEPLCGCALIAFELAIYRADLYISGLCKGTFLFLPPGCSFPCRLRQEQVPRFSGLRG